MGNKNIKIVSIKCVLDDDGDIDKALKDMLIMSLTRHSNVELTYLHETYSVIYNDLIACIAH